MCVRTGDTYGRSTRRGLQRVCKYSVVTVRVIFLAPLRNRTPFVDDATTLSANTNRAEGNVSYLFVPVELSLDAYDAKENRGYKFYFTSIRVFRERGNVGCRGRRKRLLTDCRGAFPEAR